MGKPGHYPEPWKPGLLDSNLLPDTPFVTSILQKKNSGRPKKVGPA